MRVTFLGHACHLVETGTHRIVTDPWLTDPIFAGAVERAPTLTFGVSDLPPIDAIALTHGHLDHFNAPSLAAFPDKAIPVIIPASGWTELEANLRRLGFADIRSLEDWASCEVAPDLRVTATPSLGVLDECAYMFESGNLRFWNGADAPQPPEIVGKIAGRFGAVELAALSHNSFDQPALLALDSLKDADHGPAAAAASARTLGAGFVIAAASNMRWRGDDGPATTAKVIRRSAADLDRALTQDAPGSRLLDLAPGDAWSKEGGIERAALLGSAPAAGGNDYIHAFLETDERHCGPDRPSSEEAARVHFPARLRAMADASAYVSANVKWEVVGDDPATFSVDFARGAEGVSNEAQPAPFGLRIRDTDWKDLFERRTSWQCLLVSDRLAVARYRAGPPPDGLHFAYAMQAIFP